MSSRKVVDEIVLKHLTSSRPRKLFHFLYRLPKFGVGRQFTRVIWKYDGETLNHKGSDRWGDPTCYWTISKVHPDWVKSGYVWGRLTWKGKLDPKERRILTHRKMHWKLIPLTDGQKTTGKDNNERKTENNNERKIEDNEKKAEE